MATVEEVVKDTLSSIATNAGAIVAAKWLDNRYRELVSKVKFRHLRAVGELSLPSIYNTGTVTVTRDSTSVTGVGSAWQTEFGAGAQTDYWFRTKSAWYKIASIDGELALTLSSNFAEDDVSAGSYEIVKRTHALASDARWLGEFVFTRLRKGLNVISLDALDIKAPGRTLAGNIPTYIAQVNANSSGVPVVEVYPPPEESEIIHYVYWTLPSTLAITSTIPPVIDDYVLKEGLLIDLYRFEKSRAIRNGNIEQAAIWRNEEKAQETKWRQVIKDAIRTSRGVKDITFILEMFHGNSASRRGDQRTARDYVYDNWSR